MGENKNDKTGENKTGWSKAAKRRAAKKYGKGGTGKGKGYIMLDGNAQIWDGA